MYDIDEDEAPQPSLLRMLFWSGVGMVVLLGRSGRDVPVGDVDATDGARDQIPRVGAHRSGHVAGLTDRLGGPSGRASRPCKRRYRPQSPGSPTYRRRRCRKAGVVDPVVVD